MRVWTKPELIVESFVLNSFIAVCDIDKDDSPFHYVFWRDSNGNKKPVETSWTFDDLKTSVDTSPEYGNISTAELLAYFKSTNPGHDNYIYHDGPVGKLYNS